MRTFTTDEIEQKFFEAPDNIKDFLSSEKEFENILDIAKKFQLNDSDVNILTQGITAVILGLLKPSDLLFELKSDMEANEKIITELLKVVNREIFYPLRSYLENLYKIAKHPTTPLDNIQPQQPVINPTPQLAPEQQSKPQPLIINTPTEETIQPTAPTKQKLFIFSPFKIFSSSSKNQDEEQTIKATIENFSEPKKEQPKIIHYSEYSTNLQPQADLSFETIKPVKINIESENKEKDKNNLNQTPSVPLSSSATKDAKNNQNINQTPNSNNENDKKVKLQGNTIILK
ncbi:MAG: hypothetical protein ACP5IC_02580 [Minisyncoccia bacterium]